MNQIPGTFSLIVAEAAELNRRLLMLQIECLENELLPCEDVLKDMTVHGAGRWRQQKAFLQSVTEKFSRLRRLKYELSHTEQLLSVTRN